MERVGSGRPPKRRIDAPRDVANMHCTKLSDGRQVPISWDATSPDATAYAWNNRALFPDTTLAR